MSTPQPPSGSTGEPQDPRDQSAPTPDAAASEPQPAAPPVPPSAPQAPQAPGAYQQYPGSAPQSAPYGAPAQGQAQGQGQAPYGAPQAPYAGAPAYAQSPQGGNGLAIASIVVGGIGLLLSFIGFGLIIALVGLVLGIVALVKKKGTRLLAVIGTAVSGLGVLIGIVAAVIIGITTFAAVNAVNESLPESGSFSSEAPSAGDDAAADDSAAAENLSFGQTFTYDDGVAVTVSAPEAFTPDEYAIGNDQAANVVFTVTIQNDSSANFDPTTYDTATSGGVEASQIYDGTLQNSPTTAVPAGQSITYQVAYSVADPAQIVFQTAPSFDYEDVTYTS